MQDDFGQYIKKLRKDKKMTIRQLELSSGVSNAYISQIERGDRGIPSPEIIQKISKPLGVHYEELMKRAGYITESKKVVYELPESEYDRIIRETEEEFKLNLRDDPIVLEATRELIRRLAQMKQGQR